MSTLPNYRGRFAPSPTGSLHFGSLVAAVGSYLEAKSRQGEWLLRIEDLDSPRALPGAAKEILHTLEALGMGWDGEVIYQSQRNAAYQAALARLGEQGLTYPCLCSRKEIADSSITGIGRALERRTRDPAKRGSGSERDAATAFHGDRIPLRGRTFLQKALLRPARSRPVYPGTCRNNFPDGNKIGSLRVRTDNNMIEFEDVLQGKIRQHLESDIGDFVLRRADGVYAYQLAVVVDDAEQSITHVVRGADLLDSTPRQIYLQQLLGYPTPAYLHLPVAVNTQGEKLSKQTRAAPIDATRPLPYLLAAVRFLGQHPPAELAEGNVALFWQWARENWQSGSILKEKSLPT